MTSQTKQHTILSSEVVSLNSFFRKLTCNSLSTGFFMFNGLGAYPGNVCDSSSATVAMSAMCSSDNTLAGNGEAAGPLTD
jgi:hypothetical protein